MRIQFLTGSRGEWGYIRPILHLCRQRNVRTYLTVTNMHLLPAYGLSSEEIAADGFEIDDALYMAVEGGNRFAMAKSLGVCLQSLVDSVLRAKPDWLLLAGDRGEQLMGAIVGSYTYTATAHIQAGELSGNIDGLTRHAIGKLVHLHFASNEDAANRLLRLGEESFRVHNVGAPQLDELVRGDFASRGDVEAELGIDLSKPFILVLQHPITEEFDRARDQVRETMEALREFAIGKIWIAPNNDAGSEMIRQELFTGREPGTLLFRNLARGRFLRLLKETTCIVGNSSAGLLEAPTFRVPAVNIGRRQADRVRGKNVVDVSDFRSEAIRAGISSALEPRFRESLADCGNPYGDGHSAERILNVLESTERSARLLTKKITY